MYDDVVFIGITPTNEYQAWREANANNLDSSIQVRHIPIPRASKIRRYAKSMMGSIPAIAIEFWDQRDAVGRCLRDMSQPDAAVDVIIEDIPLTVLQPTVHSSLPAASTVIRSHHVQSEAFRGFDRDGLIWNQVAWKWEIKRIKWLERRALKEADATFCISDTDARGYERVYNHTVNGVIDVCFGEAEHEMSTEGAADRIVHVGSADLRKGHGLQWFVDDVWPLVRERRPNAELHLGGRNTNRFHRPSEGVIGVGFVEDDQAFMERGGIFINPQKRGSGLKIKSVVSMLAGRALVSTETGIEGVKGQDGTHFYVRDHPGEMADVLCMLIADDDQRRTMQKTAREFASHAYDCGRFIRDISEHFPISSHPTDTSATNE